MFEALPVSSAHIGHHLDILARQLPLDTSTTQASWFRWWSRNTLQRTSEDQHVTFTYKSTAILRYFKLFWVWNIEHIEHTGKCKSHTVLPSLRIFFYSKSFANSSHTWIMFDLCCQCCWEHPKIIQNPWSSIIFPTFSHHFPTSSLCQWHNFSERLSLLRLPLGQAQSLWDPLSKRWYIYGPFIDDLHIEKWWFRWFSMGKYGKSSK